MTERDQLTPRQLEVLQYLASRIATNGVPPTYREICEHFGMRNNNGAVSHIRALTKKGMVRQFGEYTARSAVPTDAGWDASGVERVAVVVGERDAVRWKQFRRQAQAMAEMLAQGLADGEKFDADRASGECLCETCGLEYRDHPSIDKDCPSLVIVCSGKLYKL